VRCIDLSNFEERKSEIADQLWEAAVEIGFFQVSHHGIPLADIRQAFSMTEAFFALPDEVKGSIRWPAMPGKAGAGPAIDEDAGSKRVVPDHPSADGGAGPATSSCRRSKRRCWSLNRGAGSWDEAAVLLCLKAGFCGVVFHHRSRSGS
jgi:isopenicillin N synthase-like dioxygenase